MAVLKSPRSEGQHPLAPRTLIGRSPECYLQLDDPHASGEHAIILWTGRAWEIRDLGSRNGTFVDKERLKVGQRTRLNEGVDVAFGNPNRHWTFVDDAPPTLMAINTATHDVRTGEEDLLVLPDADTAEVSVYLDDTGWWVDRGEGPTPIDGRSNIQTTCGAWRIVLPSASEGTPLMQHSLDIVELWFAVSKDEELVEITVVGDGLEVVLEPREHAYVLLTLARARGADAALPAAQRGWIDRDDLERMLAMDGNALNVAIHRARQQLAAAGVQSAARVVEVRRNQRRLGTDRFRIKRLKEG